MYTYEEELIQNNITLISGTDEVGRGCMAGPVVAATVIMPLHFDFKEINDSKQLSEKKREQYYDYIIDNAISYNITYIDNNKIDEINIYQASKLAMEQSINSLSIKPEHCLIDAMKVDISIPSTPIIKGDSKSASIACASILAKVSRDRYMTKLSLKYPNYGFDKHKGYCTKLHKEALSKYGVLDIHRKTYAPIKEYLEKK